MLKALNFSIKNNDSFISYSFFFFALLVFILPDFDVIDKVGAQLFYLTILNIIYLSYCLFNFNNSLKSLFYSKINLSFILFLFISLISFFWSINLTESFVKFSHWFNIYILFFLSSFFISNISIYSLAHYVTAFLFIHLGLIFFDYYEIISQTSFNFKYADFLRGLASNKNISSALIFFCLPFSFLSAIRLKNIFYSFLIFIISFFSFYFIFALSSRSVFVSLVVCSIFLLLFMLISFFRIKKKQFISISKSFVFFFFIPAIISFVFFNSSSYNQSDVQIANRIATVNLQDASTNTRIRFYRHALDYFLENPFNGVGIGNWKFKSIDLDKLNIRGYIVPYHVHNDFLEIAVEVGLFGLLSYLCIFIFSGLSLVRFLKRFKSIEDLLLFAFLSLFIIAYFIDANLNFPHARLSQQVIFCFFLAYMVKLSQKYSK